MADIIKMDYPKMEAMANSFRQGSQQLQQTAQQMRAVAKNLEDGALIGQGGSAFVEAINTKLLPAIQRMNAKFEELAKDIEKAMQDMKQADAYSQQQFRD